MKTQTVTDSRPRQPASWWRRLVVGLISLALPCAALAQAAAGTITGRVLNPATNEYIRNAEVRIEGTNQIAVSEDGGYYRFVNAPVGNLTLTATYTGHET